MREIKEDKAVTSVKIDGYGQYIIIGSEDNSAKMYCAVSGSLLRTFEGHQDVVSGVYMS